MEPGTLILLVGAILLAAVVAAAIAGKAGVPVLVAFLGLGMLLGSDGVGGIDFSDAHLARTVGIIGLAIILFEGGITTPWRAIRPVVVPAAVLATVGRRHHRGDHRGRRARGLPARLAGVVPARRGGRLDGRGRSLLDPARDERAPPPGACPRSRVGDQRPDRRRADDRADPVGGGPFVRVARTARPDRPAAERRARARTRGRAGGSLGDRPVTAAAAQFGPVATLAAGAIGFGLADVAGGSGFLAVYIVGLFVGNTATPLRRALVNFHAGLAFLAQVGLFIVLGLFVFPRQLGPVILPGLAVVVVLLFVARPLAVWVSTAFQGFAPRERALLGWAGLRGAVPIVLATYPQAAGLPESTTIFNAVFFVVLGSALIQGPTLEPFARALGLTGHRGSYEPPLEVAAVDSLGSGLLEFGVAGDSAVVGRHVRELGLPRDALVAVIVRDGEAVPPRGSTVVESGDRLYVLSRKESRRTIERLFDAWRPS